MHFRTTSPERDAFSRKIVEDAGVRGTVALEVTSKPKTGDGCALIRHRPSQLLNDFFAGWGRQPGGSRIDRSDRVGDYNCNLPTFKGRTERCSPRNHPLKIFGPQATVKRLQLLQ